MVAEGITENIMVYNRGWVKAVVVRWWVCAF